MKITSESHLDHALTPAIIELINSMYSQAQHALGGL